MTDTTKALVEEARRRVQEARDFVKRTGGRSDGDQVVIALADTLTQAADALALHQGGEAKERQWERQCPHCEGRGFVLYNKEYEEQCLACEGKGRVVECVACGHSEPAGVNAPSSLPVQQGDTERLALARLARDDDFPTPAEYRAAIALRDRILAEAGMPSPPAPTPPTHRECDDCDGCGWYEGGPAIMTNCKTCGGSGVIAIDAARQHSSPGNNILDAPGVRGR